MHSSLRRHLLVTIPKRAAEELAKALPLAVYSFAIAPYRLRAFFHTTRNAGASAGAGIV